MLSLDEKKITDMIKTAGEKMLGREGSEDITVKGLADFVTKNDKEIQQFIKTELERMYPEVGFMGEEEDCKELQEKMWILDPIDGTTNYIYNYRHSAISLALYERNEITFGIIYDPYLQEIFLARKGGGAYLNDEKIHVNDTRKLSKALVAVGTTPYYKEMASKVFDVMKRIFLASLDIRRTGTAVLDLAYVACGRQDAYLEYKLKPWDFAAGSLLVQEAGGIVKGIDEDIYYDRPVGIMAVCSDEIMVELQQFDL